MVSIFSGALIPLDLYSGVLRTVVFALPFHSMAHTPTCIFLERDMPLAGLLGEQAAWAALLWMAGMLAWRSAQRVLTVQGG